MDMLAPQGLWDIPEVVEVGAHQTRQLPEMVALAALAVVAAAVEDHL